MKSLLRTEARISELRGLFESCPTSFGGNLRKDAKKRRQHESVCEPPTAFYTLRLEHRTGGITMNRLGEERLLIFRSDRPGVIGKIIFSSETPTTPTSKNIFLKNYNSKNVYRNGICNEPKTMAKIHVLEVKEEYRGRDLGSFLFQEAVRSIRKKTNDESYVNSLMHDEINEGSSMTRLCDQTILLQLDVEEDIRRHNKLINFYKRLGCSVKPNSKIQILYNNDGETYRRIPMQSILFTTKNSNCMDATYMCNAESPPHYDKKRKMENIESNYQSDTYDKAFLPIRFVQRNATSLNVLLNFGCIEKESKTFDWLIVQEKEGLSFRTTQGHWLFANPEDGSVYAGLMQSESFMNDENLSIKNQEFERFHIIGASDILIGSHDFGVLLYDRTLNDTGSNVYRNRGSQNRRNLFVIQTEKKKYLGINRKSNTLTFSEHPMFWTLDSDYLNLICTNDTPDRRYHYRSYWEIQCVDYVKTMHRKYEGFKLAKISIRDALDVLKHTKSRPFFTGEGVPSVRSYLYGTAEAVRKCGYPDWMQLIALIHDMGRVVRNFDLHEDYDKFDWTLGTCSHVVGCAAPSDTIFEEFKDLNPDFGKNQYNTSIGCYKEHCGLTQSILSWTGPEYLSKMLKHNKVQIPEEGLLVLRLFLLRDWHHYSHYTNIESISDKRLKPAVHQFDRIRQKVKNEFEEEICDDRCSWLWDNHYRTIAEKYECHGELLW